MVTKKGVILLLVLVLTVLLVIPVVYSWNPFKELANKITGWASAQTALSITIGNTAPYIESIYSIPTQSVTEGGTTNITFWFTATDIDGYATLDNSSAKGNFNRTGETSRANNSCSAVKTLDTDTINYSCTIAIWYWDGAGSWSINISVNDTSAAQATNVTTAFTLQETTAMTMNQTALTWPTITLLSTNQTSNNDPIEINNTANDDIADGGVKVNATNLIGQTNASQVIYATNFTVDIDTGGGPPPAECNGVIMANNTLNAITGATITAGNNSAGSGQEQIYFCLVSLTGIPSVNISQQDYSTTGTKQWTVVVS